jgi:hypothetical protein
MAVTELDGGLGKVEIRREGMGKQVQNDEVVPGPLEFVKLKIHRINIEGKTGLKEAQSLATRWKGTFRGGAKLPSSGLITVIALDKGLRVPYNASHFVA